jgi:hypothetical protein
MSALLANHPSFIFSVILHVAALSESSVKRDDEQKAA